jgi:hypothetical protein
MALKIWHNEGNYVIAESPDDAMNICAIEFGYKSREEYDHDYELVDADWTAWPDDKPFPFSEELEYEEDPPTAATLELGPGEVLKKRGEPCEAWTYYTVESDGHIYTKTRRRHPEVWITENGRGYFATTEN